MLLRDIYWVFLIAVRSSKISHVRIKAGVTNTKPDNHNLNIKYPFTLTPTGRGVLVFYLIVLLVAHLLNIALATVMGWVKDWRGNIKRMCFVSLRSLRGVGTYHLNRGLYMYDPKVRYQYNKRKTCFIITIGASSLTGFQKMVPSLHVLFIDFVSRRTLLYL